MSVLAPEIRVDVAGYVTVITLEPLPVVVNIGALPFVCALNAAGVVPATIVPKLRVPETVKTSPWITVAFKVTAVLSVLCAKDIVTVPRITAAANINFFIINLIFVSCFLNLLFQFFIELFENSIL